MKKIKKIKIKLNGKNKSVNIGTSLNDLINNLNIPIKKVAIEFNKEITDKKDIKKIKLKDNDIIEIVHFIGGG
jgi:thiamine biosynthesis protein ThiS